MLRVSFTELHHTLTQAMLRLGFSAERAAECARLFAETTRDGVYTHGLNRFARFAATVRNGAVDVQATPVRAPGGTGLAIERWNGRRGPGNLNALASTERAISLAREHGLGAVALANTNHWMRGGTYGWHAAEQGLVAICWTNTGRNLPAWGSTAATLGNNPLVLAVPRPGDDGSYTGGPHVVLDMALSQFSYGQLSAYARRGEQLPVPGGYDADGLLTNDPSAITESLRALPIGFWKGSGLALLLDLLAAALSGGRATHQISSDPLEETDLSQIFLAIDPAHIAAPQQMAQTAEDLIHALHAAPRAHPDHPPRYPGEETRRIREENNRLGVPVEEDAWQNLQDFA